MQIYGPVHLHGPQSIGAPHNPRLTAPAGAPRPAGTADEVQISSFGQLLDRLGDLPAVRGERIEQIRAQIAAGTYETDEKLSLALDRLLDELA